MSADDFELVPNFLIGKNVFDELVLVFSADNSQIRSYNRSVGFDIEVFLRRSHEKSK
jgi:hypothetical protein